MVLACRDFAKAERAAKAAGLPKESYTIMHLDLASLTSVRQFVDHFRLGYTEFDALTAHMTSRCQLEDTDEARSLVTAALHLKALTLLPTVVMSVQGNWPHPGCSCLQCSSVPANSQGASVQCRWCGAQRNDEPSRPLSACQSASGRPAEEQEAGQAVEWL